MSLSTIQDPHLPHLINNSNLRLNFKCSIESFCFDLPILKTGEKTFTLLITPSPPTIKHGRIFDQARK